MLCEVLGQPRPPPHSCNTSIIDYSDQLKMSASGSPTLSAEVMGRANTLVCRRMPQGDEDWDCVLASPEQVEQLRRRLTLDLSPLTSVHSLYEAYAERISRASENDLGFLKILALGTGLVLLKEVESRSSRYSLEREETNQQVLAGVRRCFRGENLGGAALTDKVVHEYMMAVALGAQVLASLVGKLGLRAYELPWHGMSATQPQFAIS